MACRPGWIGRLVNEHIEDGVVNSSALFAPQKFCRLSITATSGRLSHEAQSSGDRSPLPQAVQPSVQDIMQLLLQSAAKVLRKAELSGDDVVTMQLFYNSMSLKSEGYEVANIEADWEQQVAEQPSGLPMQAPLPVLGIGLLPKADSDFLLDALCLRTEVPTLS